MARPFVLIVGPLPRPTSTHEASYRGTAGRALTLIQVNKTTGALTVVKNIHFDATHGVNWPDG
jgi:hypothetical protein